MKMTATVALVGTLIAPVTSRAQQTPPAGSQATDPVPIATRVDSAIARQMQMRRIPGLSLGVVKNGALLLAKGYGDATVEWKAPATPDTVYLLASMTKSFTAIAIMMLADAGRLSIDAPISRYVAGTPAS